MASEDGLTDFEREIVAAWEKSGTPPEDPTEARNFWTLHERGVIDGMNPPVKAKKATTAKKASEETAAPDSK